MTGPAKEVRPTRQMHASRPTGKTERRPNSVRTRAAPTVVAEARRLHKQTRRLPLVVLREPAEGAIKVDQDFDRERVVEGGTAGAKRKTRVRNVLFARSLERKPS